MGGRRCQRTPMAMILPEIDRSGDKESNDGEFCPIRSPEEGVLRWLELDSRG